MKRLLVWDLPVRLFHVLLALSFFAAFAIAQLVDDEDPLFPVHMLLGLLMTAMVVLRLVWGLVGTRHARFRDFVVGPRKVLAYLRAAIGSKADRHAGHNPGAAMAILAIFAFVLGLAVTGVMMGQGNHAVEDLHGLLAWGFFVTVVAHLAGVALHTIKHKELIALSMVDGKKEVEPQHAIPSARPLAGLAFLTIVGVVGWHLGSNYDAASRQLHLPILGQTLQLGEVEDEGRRGHDDDRDHERRDHDDDD